MFEQNRLWPSLKGEPKSTFKLWPRMIAGDGASIKKSPEQMDYERIDVLKILGYALHVKCIVV